MTACVTQALHTRAHRHGPLDLKGQSLRHTPRACLSSPLALGEGGRFPPAWLAPSFLHMTRIWGGSNCTWVSPPGQSAILHTPGHGPPSAMLELVSRTIPPPPGGCLLALLMGLVGAFTPQESVNTTPQLSHQEPVVKYHTLGVGIVLAPSPSLLFLHWHPSWRGEKSGLLCHPFSGFLHSGAVGPSLP